MPTVGSQPKVGGGDGLLLEEPRSNPDQRADIASPRARRSPCRVSGYRSRWRYDAHAVG